MERIFYMFRHYLAIFPYFQYFPIRIKFLHFNQDIWYVWGWRQKNGLKFLFVNVYSVSITFLKLDTFLNHFFSCQRKQQSLYRIEKIINNLSYKSWNNCSTPFCAFNGGNSLESTSLWLLLKKLCFFLHCLYIPRQKKPKWCENKVIFKFYIAGESFSIGWGWLV